MKIHGRSDGDAMCEIHDDGSIGGGWIQGFWDSQFTNLEAFLADFGMVGTVFGRCGGWQWQPMLGRVGLWRW